MTGSLPKGFCAPVELGRGGEARTILCWQEDPGRWVVLKVASASRASSLKREAQILQQLAGGPVPALFGQNLSGRSPWLALTWIDGIPLDALPASLSVADRKAIILQASLAAARLHAARMVHGDMSAANLVARPHGEVGVVDFGLSPFPGSSEVPSVEGAWDILPPERLRGEPPDPRWDVFALGVIGARLLGAFPASVGSRDEWTEFVVSGEAAKCARGRSWGLAQALDPDPAARPVDAAALVRLLEREWGDPPFSRDLFAIENARRLEAMFAGSVREAISRGDWESAWRLQRERIERAPEPEPLLAQLGEFQRLRRNPPARAKFWIGSAAALFLGGAIVVWKISAPPEDNPSVLEPASSLVGDVYGEFQERTLQSQGVLVFDPPPEGARMLIDGVSSPPPPDGFLKLRPGTRHVELLDSSDAEILDTTIVVPSIARKLRTKSRVEPGASSAKQSGTPGFTRDSVNKKVKP